MKKAYQIVCFLSFSVYIITQMDRFFQSCMQTVSVIYLLDTDKEVCIISWQNILEVLQEGESGLRRELACIGLELRKEQMQELYQTQQQALRRYRWVETKEDRLFDILGPFLKSPYMALPTYMLHLKQSIWLYYHVRSHISWQVSDEALCEILYEEHLLYHGEINRQLALRILQRVKRSQEE